MALKLYGAPMSTCTARVLTCLLEKDADFELIPINLLQGEQKKPEFLSMNPFGQVPALEDGDLTLFESRAISSYVAEKLKGTGSDLLRQEDLKAAAMVKVWTEVESQQFSPAIAPIFFQYLLVPMRGGSPDQAIIDDSSAKLAAVLDVYEKRLAGSKYLAGDFYSLADLYHIPIVYYVMKTPCAKLFNERAHVKAWWVDISGRPAFQKVAPGLTLGQK